MNWRPKTDRDALKEVWPLFENAQGQYPLYPGQRTTITYSWHIGIDKWGNWFQRTVRLPTRRLSIEVDFPAAMRPVVWGVVLLLLVVVFLLCFLFFLVFLVDGRAHFSWETESPALLVCFLFF